MSEKEMASKLNKFYLKIKDITILYETIPTILESRIEKITKEPIRIISSTMVKYLNEYEFKIKGSTGKIYLVKIGPKLDCECKDFKTRGIHCKHILYVLLKEIEFNDLSSNIFKSIYLSDKILHELFLNYHPK